MVSCVLRMRALFPLLGPLPSNVLTLRIYFRWHHSYLCSCWHVVYIRTYCVDILRYSTIEPFDEYFFWIYLLTKMTASLKIKLLISKLLVVSQSASRSYGKRRGDKTKSTRTYLHEFQLSKSSPTMACMAALAGLTGISHADSKKLHLLWYHIGRIMVIIIRVGINIIMRISLRM